MRRKISSRLRERGLGGKRNLALREFALGHEALKRFVAREPLRRVHECVFAVLALESEPIDPRTLTGRVGDCVSARLVTKCGRSNTQWGKLMKALILYVGLVAVGAVISGLIGVYIEHTISWTVSLIAFLTMFFANFAISWLIVIYIMDGTLKKA